MIKKLIDCYRIELDKSILEDIQDRQKEINGILEVIGVLNEGDYWK